MELDFRDRLRMKLYQSGAHCGLPLLPHEKCLQLLAWLYVYGGEQEKSTDGGILTAHLLHAQERLRAYGTGVPAPETVQSLKRLVNECYQPERPAWLLELCAEYGVKAKYGQEVYR